MSNKALYAIGWFLVFVNAVCAAANITFFIAGSGHGASLLIAGVHVGCMVGGIHRLTHWRLS